MTNHATVRFAIGLTVVAAACTSQPPVTTTTTTSSSGVLMAGVPEGMWLDSVGGTWMDNEGGFWRGGRNGVRIGLQPDEIRTWNDANIVAHLAAGDSLEVVLSQQGADHAQNSAVRDFARRMVSEHTAHLQMGRQMATQGNITPMPSPADTADAQMASRVIARLSNGPTDASYDRQLMRAEVVMHQHMLHELTTVQPQATGVARQLVDQTIPVVRQHLADAQATWRQVGGGMNDGRSGATPKP